MTDEEILAARIEKINPEFVYVGRPDAYEQFISGSFLFDVRPDAGLLAEFSNKNAGELGHEMVFPKAGPPRSFISIKMEGHLLHVLFHRNASRERMTPEARSVLEKEYPELFVNL
ncbi:MAG: hypothetical protein QOJ99_3420 [Bryobacterales bacterium]|jgi:hypothetical protein|nr:hypothetical protein [Bryobacterales bacterium]